MTPLGHERGDIECLHHDAAAYTEGARCGPCRRDTTALSAPPAVRPAYVDALAVLAFLVIAAIVLALCLAALIGAALLVRAGWRSF